MGIGRLRGRYHDTKQGEAALHSIITCGISRLIVYLRNASRFKTYILRNLSCWPRTYQGRIGTANPPEVCPRKMPSAWHLFIWHAARVNLYL